MSFNLPISVAITFLHWALNNIEKIGNPCPISQTISVDNKLIDSHIFIMALVLVA